MHAVNPKQLDRFRDRHTVAGAKDDRRDARVLADALRTDPHCFRRLEATAADLVEMREWSRAVEELQQERTRLSNRIRQQLWRYYPQVLGLGDDVAADWLLELWDVAPTPADAARLRPARVARTLAEHRIRRIGPGEALGILRRPALTVAPGTTEAAVARIRLLAARARLVNTQLREAHHSSTSSATGPRAAGESMAPLPTRRSCAPCRGSAGSSSPPCSARPPSPWPAATTMPSGTFAASRP